MFDNYIYLEFNKTNILNQGVLTPLAKIKKLRLSNTSNTRYNNISRKVLGFKSPNEVLKEYKENQQVKDTLGKKYFF